MEGGLKLSELGSCSASVALGSEVAISPPLMDLCLGNNSAEEKLKKKADLGVSRADGKYEFGQFRAIYLSRLARSSWL